MKKPSTLYASASMGYGRWGEFDITALAKEWKNGTRNANCGLILVNPNESSTSVEKTVYSSEYGNSAYWPYVMATYSAPISLNQTSLEVNMGSTATITLSGGTAASWSSSNTLVATVSSSGVVTGVRAGTATVTVTDSYGNAASCTVTVKMAENTYRITNTYYSKKMTTSSTAQTPSYKIRGSASSTTAPSAYGQIWKLTYLNNGYYSISPSYMPDGYLTLYGGGALAIRQTLNNTAQWKIYYSSNGYVLQNRYTGYYLNMSMDSATDYGVHFASTVGSIAKWSVDYAYVPSGLALYDTENFAWVDTASTAYLELGSSLQAVCMPVGQSVGNYSISTNSVASCANAGVITGISRGAANVTVSANTNGSTRQLTFPLVVFKTVTVVSYYDDSFNATLHGYIDDAVDFLNKVYLDEFQLYYVSAGEPTEYSEIDDSYEQCTQSGACNSSQTACDNFCLGHHKNTRRISQEMVSKLSENQVAVLWTNHSQNYYCNGSGYAHSTTSAYGVTYFDGVPITSDNLIPRPATHILHIPETTPEKIKSYLAITLAHEIAHTLGIHDTYNNEFGENDYREHGHYDITYKPDGDTLIGPCIMSSYDLDERGDYYDFYNEVKNGEVSGICAYCLDKLNDEISLDPYA